MKNLSIVAAVSCAIAATTAFAKDEVGILPNADSLFQKWGEESGWTIYADRSRNSCLIEKTDESGNVVQMGLTEVRSVGYLGIFTKADIDLEEGEDPVIVAFDDAVFTGMATRKTKHLPDGYKGGYVLTDDPQFVDLVQRKYEMIVFPGEEYAIAINLDGSMKAIDAARKCNEDLSG
ncbi:MAG: hypothetical protein AB3N23_09570 [Paracoccaceae bacterium]